MELQAVTTLTKNVLASITDSMAKFKLVSQIDTIENTDQESMVIDFSKAIRQRIKDVKKERLSYVSGATKWVSDANAVFKPVKDKLEKLKDLIDDRLKAYQFKLEEVKRIENEKILKAQEEANKKNQEDAPFLHSDDSPPIEIPAQIMDAPKSKKTENASANYRTVMKWRVKDFDAVPKAYLMVDHSSVDDAIAHGEKIPGIETYEDKILTIR